MEVPKATSDASGSRKQPKKGKPMVLVCDACGQTSQVRLANCQLSVYACPTGPRH